MPGAAGGRAARVPGFWGLQCRAACRTADGTGGDDTPHPLRSVAGREGALPFRLRDAVDNAGPHHCCACCCCSRVESRPQAAWMSSPREARIVVCMPLAVSVSRKRISSSSGGEK